MAGKLLSKRAAARYLGCSPTTLYGLIAEGKLHVFVPWGAREKLRLADLDKLIESKPRSTKKRRIS